MYAYIHKHVHVYVYIYIYNVVCVSLCVCGWHIWRRCVHIHVYIFYIFLCIFAYKYVHTYIYIYTHIYIYIYNVLCVCMCVQVARLEKVLTILKTAGDDVPADRGGRGQGGAHTPKDKTFQGGAAERRGVEVGGEGGVGVGKENATAKEAVLIKGVDVLIKGSATSYLGGPAQQVWPVKYE